MQPGSIPAFNHSSFSGSNVVPRLIKVSGAALFYLQMLGELKEHPIIIAFSNPFVQSIKTRAEFTSNMKEIWDRMVNND